jgi:hypothetical protein
MRGKTKLKVAALPVIIVFGLIIVMTGRLFAPNYSCGCTPGYWKNHLNEWTQCFYKGQMISPNEPLVNYFDLSYPQLSGLSNDTLLQALRYQGGPGIVGGARILLRSAVGALLNGAHIGLRGTNSPCLGYAGLHPYFCFRLSDPNDPASPWLPISDEDFDCMITGMLQHMNAALRTGSREAMIHLAYDFDIFNNMTCPLGN